MVRKKLSLKDLLIIGSGIIALIVSVVLLSKDMIHYLYEALAIPFGFYFIYYGINKAKGFNRYLFIVFGAGNIIIDGYLLLKNIFGLF